VTPWNATRRLRDLGQSLWLGNITRDLLDTGRLQRYIDELSVTGLASNPTIFDHVVKSSPPTTPPSARTIAARHRPKRSSSS
jgi:transaldolase